MYIIERMIQILSWTQYNPKTSVSLLHSMFLLNLLFLTLTVAFTLIEYLLTLSIDLTFSYIFSNEESLLFIWIK